MGTKGYGWKSDTFDHRDKVFDFAALPMAVPAAFVDLRPQMPPVYDQGQLGSCTANGIAACIQFERMRQKLPAFNPSRLFIYYNERAMEGTVKSDSGAAIRDGIKSMATQGDCPETQWPYDISKFKNKPTAACYKAALQYKAVTYQSVPQSAGAIKAVLSNGFPIVFGITVYQSFESAEVAKSGIVPMPAPKEPTLGGHCIVLVGYDNVRGQYLCRNSWGTGWGIGGYFWLPVAYVESSKLASDFWTIQLESA